MKSLFSLTFINAIIKTHIYQPYRLQCSLIKLVNIVEKFICTGYLELIQIRIKSEWWKGQRSTKAEHKYEINTPFEKLLQQTNADNATTVVGKYLFYCVYDLQE